VGDEGRHKLMPQIEQLHLRRRERLLDQLAQAAEQSRELRVIFPKFCEL
jgi:hypothetical protein